MLHIKLKKLYLILSDQQWKPWLCLLRCNRPATGSWSWLQQKPPKQFQICKYEPPRWPEQMGFNLSRTLCFPIKGSNVNSSIVWQETKSRLPNHQTRFATFHSSGTITIALVEFKMLNYGGLQALYSSINILFEYGTSRRITGKKVPNKWSIETRTLCISNSLQRIKLKRALGILHCDFLLKSPYSNPNQ